MKWSKPFLAVTVFGAVVLSAAAIQTLVRESADMTGDASDQHLSHSVCEGGPVPLVAIHGSPGSSDDFATLAPALRDHFTVYAFDMPGFGESPRVPGGWGYAAAADALAETLRGLDLADSRPVVAGFSWGGGVAIALAARYPEMVSGVVLIAGVGVPDGFHTGSWYTETLRTLAAGPLVLGYPGALVGAALPFGQRQAFWAHFLGGDTRQTERRLRSIGVPVVVLHDPEDTVVGVAGPARHAKFAPHGSFYPYDGGHGLIYGGGGELAPTMLRAMRREGLL